ncbi:MAG: histidine phosphatase family protein [Acidimicrobiales bacterium]
MTVVHLARHGQSSWHEWNRYAGHTDVPLTAAGREQAEAFGRWAVTRPIVLVASSDLRRSLDTAAPAARLLGVDVVVDWRLREVDFGDAEGLTPTEIEAAWPERWESFLARPATAPLPGAEPGPSAVDRYRAALFALSDRAASADGELLVIAHRTALRLWLCQSLGVPLDDYRRSFPWFDNTQVISGRLEEDGDFILISS